MMRSEVLAGESFQSMKSREVADSASPMLGGRRHLGRGSNVSITAAGTLSAYNEQYEK
jgi:hypothetical protein